MKFYPTLLLIQLLSATSAIPVPPLSAEVSLSDSVRSWQSAVSEIDDKISAATMKKEAFGRQEKWIGGVGAGLTTMGTVGYVVSSAVPVIRRQRERSALKQLNAALKAKGCGVRRKQQQASGKWKTRRSAEEPVLNAASNLAKDGLDEDRESFSSALSRSSSERFEDVDGDHRLKVVDHATDPRDYYLSTSPPPSRRPSLDLDHIHSPHNQDTTPDRWRNDIEDQLHTLYSSIVDLKHHQHDQVSTFSPFAKTMIAVGAFNAVGGIVSAELSAQNAVQIKELGDGHFSYETLAQSPDRLPGSVIRLDPHTFHHIDGLTLDYRKHAIDRRHLRVVRLTSTCQHWYAYATNHTKFIAMMPSPQVDPRLPCYEGHLTLNRAVLVDGLDSSNSTAWTETWCSLEDGRLLVYTDRTAALINPEQTCAVIDVRSFAAVQASNIASEYGYELILSLSPPESTKSGRLFRPKSAWSLSRPHSDSPLRDADLESQPRSSMASFSRASLRGSPLTLNGASFSSTNVELYNSDSAQSRSWSKIASGSRNLYSKASTSSNGSLRKDVRTVFHPDSATSSASSFSATRSSSDTATNGVASPCTPLSPTFSASCERIVMGVASLETLRSWSDAFKLTIKLYNEMDLIPLPLLGQRRSIAGQLSFSNLAGFRTRASLAASPVFPTHEMSSDATLEETTPKASRKRHASVTSFAFALQASSHLQQQTDVHPTAPRQDRPRSVLDRGSGGVPLTEHHPVGKTVECQPVTIGRRSSFAPEAFAIPSTKREESKDRHKRSFSTASSSLLSSAIDRLSINRRDSLSSGQPLASGKTSYTSVAGVDVSKTPSQDSFLQPQIQDRPQSQNIAESTARDTPPPCRHRRSGSLLHFASTRVMAWRDVTAASASSETRPPNGLGFEVDRRETVSGNQAERKTTKSFQKFRSLRSLAKSKPVLGQGGLDRLSSSISRGSEDRGGDQSSASVRSAMASTKGKGMSRTSSLLSLTKTTFSSLRGRASSRQDVRTVFAAPHKADGGGDEDETLAGDFSYEIVKGTQEGGAVGSALLPSAIADGASQVSLAGAPDVDQLSRASGLDVDPALAAGPAELTRHPYSLWDDDTSSPRLPVERILPPEQIIRTFDELRYTPQPSPRSTLGDAICGPLLRAAASQTFVRGEASQNLRGCVSTWELGGLQAGGRRAVEKSDARVAQRRVAGEVALQRSLPAPPRGRRRARRVASQPVMENDQNGTVEKEKMSRSAFGDVTNIKKDDSKTGQAVTTKSSVDRVGLTSSRKPGRSRGAVGVDASGCF
ncbi:phosphoglycerate mutase [Pseudozyma hubeiensis SY62]|uniref:Phosphoglycerate mutase n=1 Tax=Pseudozyma hubeiensis (strain SY62) TaxID=1305764 RepID=R9PDX5_PSEHS|nr:phosphoglycerate mutase [Pseudozyma hubeiensis SY62]GAC99556.1 phosphoglycerate mutase [Pseudozyma hubeiensis SY62]